MDNKIQKLTDQLYNEGVAKGKAEQERIVSEANEAAAKILADAKAEAAALLEQAKESAESQKQNSVREIALAARQMTTDVKHTLGAAVTAKSVSSDVKSAFSDDTFIKELITEMVKSGLTEGTIKISQKSKDSVESFLKSKIATSLDALSVVADSSVVNGFKVQPKDQGYYISFTDKEFDAMLKEYLRPYILNILFGESE